MYASDKCSSTIYKRATSRTALNSDIKSYSIQRIINFNVTAYTHTASTDLNSQRFDVVGAICSTRKVGQVELDLIPSTVEAHWKHTDERMDSGRALVVTCSESTSDVLVVQNLRPDVTYKSALHNITLHPRVRKISTPHHACRLCKNAPASTYRPIYRNSLKSYIVDRQTCQTE
jgi:hypothetical protein